MPKNSRPGGWREPQALLRLLVGILAVATVAALGLVLYPPGGSAEDLARKLAELRAQATQKRALLATTRQHVAAVEKGRSEGEQFLNEYFLARRTAYSTLLSELVEAADRASIKPKEHAYATEPIEGSDTLSMMTISANYEGTYANLMRFVHEIDKSPRMLIIEGLTAAPQQTGGVLSVSMKIDAFVRENGTGPGDAE
jgi:Tfp pilus assembly protein PilO